MSDEPTPERMDALLDGAAPVDDAERDVLHLAARVRDAAPRPDERLRTRLQDLGEPAGPPRAPGRRLAWTLGPALGALLAVIVAVGILGGDSADRDPATRTTSMGTADRSAAGATASESASAPPAAEVDDRAFTATAPAEPAPWRWEVPASDVDGTVAAIRAAVAAAGGTSTLEAAGGATRVRVDVPPERLAPLRDELARLAVARSGPGAAAAPVAVPVIVIDVTGR